MCLLYFRIYRETVKRRKELHLLQAQHQTSYAQPTANNNSNNRLTKQFNQTGGIPILERDESISTDSTRSHGKVQSIQNSSIKKLISSKQTSKNKFNQTLHYFCCDTK
jgi:hypothetical protein